MHDEEAAIPKAFQNSKIQAATATHATCYIHGSWKLAARKMKNGKTFGIQAASEYCQKVRLASCLKHYEDAMDKMVLDLTIEEDLVRAEFIQSTLAADDQPLCTGDLEFMGLVNNPAEQNNQTYKGQTKGKRMTMLQWVGKTLSINRAQSMKPPLEIKVSSPLQGDRASSEDLVQNSRNNLKTSQTPFLHVPNTL